MLARAVGERDLALTFSQHFASLVTGRTKLVSFLLDPSDDVSWKSILWDLLFANGQPAD